MRKLLSLLSLSIVFLLFATSIGCAHSYSGGPWAGKVIDAETKEPIEGAVVVAEWSETFAAIPETSSRFRGSKEVLTDSEGIFKIDAQSFFSLLPDSKIHGPFITIFKPSYGYFPSYQISPKDWKKDYFEKPGAVVELPKWKSVEERRKNLPGGRIPGIFNFKELKIFKNLLNKERAEIGYVPISEE